MNCLHCDEPMELGDHNGLCGGCRQMFDDYHGTMNFKGEVQIPMYKGLTLRAEVA